MEAARLHAAPSAGRESSGWLQLHPRRARGRNPLPARGVYGAGRAG